MKDKRFGSPLKKLLPLVFIFAFLAAAVANLQSISDYARLYGYEPPADVASLARETAMTEEAKKLFYVNRPEVIGRASFNDVCQRHGEQTIVLGCYHSVDRGIYLFDVSDDRLAGVEQVTAAHEMLHSAYDRLSSSERQRIDGLLQQFYESQVLDSRVRETIASYRKADPTTVPNEMHSILATEIVQLSPELETYYKRYFTDRSQVVKFTNQYQQEFTSRQDKVKSYDTALATLKNQIDENTTILRNQESSIATLQRQMETDKNSGNVTAYNDNVPLFNTRVEQYNELIRTTQSAIAEYNRIVVERNQLAIQVRELTESISSELSPIE